MLKEQSSSQRRSGREVKGRLGLAKEGLVGQIRKFEFHSDEMGSH